MEIDPNTRDIQLMIRLIEEMANKYNIDKGRVFMQGMSMGDLMTMQFARVFGEKLAGAANAAGPTPIEALFTEEGDLRPYSVPVPVLAQVLALALALAPAPFQEVVSWAE